MYNYYVYILKCSDDSFYTGITNNLNKRIDEHQKGYNKKAYTFMRRPLSLVFHHKFNNVLEAIYFEKQIKGWTRSKKLALINGNTELLQILSECRNASHFKYAKK